MKLLKIRENKPYKDRNSNIEFLRDWCCLFFEDDLSWQFYLNGEIKKGSNLITLRYFLRDIIKEKQAHSKTDKERRLVIWTNSLSSLKNYILTIENDLSIHLIEKFCAGKKQIIVDLIFNKDLEFRNFDLISGETIEEVKQTYGFDSKGINIMVSFLKKKETQGLKGWNQIRYTFSNNNLKIFYKRFSPEVMKELYYEQIRRVPSLNVYQTLAAANKSGVMFFDPNIQSQLIKNVYSYDISSAYNSQFIRGNDFPIGKIYKTNNNELPTLIKENKWFMFAMISEYKIQGLPRWITPYEKDGYYYYIIGNYDYKCLQELGIKLSSIDKNWKIYSVYECDTIGYLNTNFRKELNNLYNERQSLKRMGLKEEKIKKQIAEVLYGKGIQKRELSCNSEIFKFYKTHNNYIDAQISFHALQRTRYEIVLMLSRLNWSYIACDTDSIKTQNPAAPQIFEERNKEIMKENLEAGFNTKIGLWKFEGLYPHFIQFGNKVYAYEENSKIKCKFAGCLTNASEDYFKKLSLEEGLKALQNPNLSIPNGIVIKTLQIGEQGFYIKKTSYSYGVVNGIDKEEIK